MEDEKQQKNRLSISPAKMPLKSQQPLTHKRQVTEAKI